MTASTPLGMTSLHLCIKHPVVATCAACCAAVCYTMFGADDGRMVAITFDDGFATDHSVALQELKQRDMKATAFINPGTIDVNGRLTLDQLLEMRQAGWEIGSHGMNHLDYTQITATEIAYDLVDATVWFADNDLGSLTSFATPFGAFNQDVVDIIAKHYRIHANAWSEFGGLNTRRNIDPLNVHRQDFNNTTVAEVCNKLATVGDNSLYTILFHEIVPGDVSADYKTSYSDFLDVLECIEAEGLRTVTLTEGVDYLLEGKATLGQ